MQSLCLPAQVANALHNATLQMLGNQLADRLLRREMKIFPPLSLRAADQAPPNGSISSLCKDSTES